MSNLKDTDFDDLFRRASDKYPLRTDSSNWDRMAAALEKDPTPDQPYDLDNTDKRRKRRFFWLFLLLPLGGLGYYAWHQTGHTAGHAANSIVRTNPAPAGSGSTQAAAAQPAATQPAAAQPATAQPADITPGDATGPTPARATGAPTPGRTDNNDKSASTAGSGRAASPTNGAGRQNATPGRNKTSSGTTTASPGRINASADGNTTPVDRTTSDATPTTRTLANANPSGKKGRNARSGKPGPAVPANAIGTSNPRTTGFNTPTTAGAGIPTTTGANNPITGAHNPIAAVFSLRASDVNEQRARIANAYRLTVDVKATPIPKDTPSAKKKATAKPRSSYLYAGILVAPDLSTVKFQSLKGMGSTFGVLVGYAFNDRWAVETGAYVDRKRYYTSGEYFNTKYVRLPPNTWLNTVDGTCYMWEIPLNVRYNFNPGGKTKWFATAGLSTYLMTREKYNYNYGWSSGSWGGNHDSSWDIKRPSQYPFSIINLSAGFEQHLGRIGNLRIEPYVHIPLTGVGTGKLRITSAGVNIGITRRLW